MARRTKTSTRARPRRSHAIALALLGALAAFAPDHGRAQDAPPKQEERKLTFNFRRASIATFLGYLSRDAGFTFIDEAGVTGDITAVAEQPMTRDQALEVLRAWLLPKQRTLLRTGDVVRLVTLDEARRRGLPVRVGADPANINDNDELVTQVMPLHYVRAEDVQRELAGLVSDRGTLMKEATSNALVVTDTSASIRRFAEVLAALDRAVTAELHVRVFRLENADATEVSAIIDDLFSGASTTGRGQQGGGGGRGGRGGGGPDPREMMQMFFQRGGGGGGGGATGTGGAQTTAVNVSADARTNSVVVTASTDQLRLVEELVTELDRDPDPVVAQVKAIPLVNADATELAATLTKIFEEETTQTTGRGGGGGGNEMPGWVRRMMGGQGGGGGGGGGTEADQAAARYAPRPRFATDTRTNTLIVSATQADLGMIEQLARDLDKDPTETSSVLVIQLQNAEAPALAEVLNDVLAQSAASGTTNNRQQQQGQTGRQQRMALANGGNAASESGEGGAGALVGNVTVTADEASNALVVTTSPKNFDRVRAIVASLDVARREVFIECLIAEVQLSDRGELGIQWNAAFTNSIEDAEEGQSTVGTDFGLDSLQDGLRYTTSSDKITGLLRALRTEGRLDILSSPKVLVLENQPAEISVGQEVPYVTNSRVTTNGDTVNTIQYRDVGIILRVTPQISDDGTVKMVVHPEVSSIAPDAQSVPISEGVRSPTFNKNFADTTIVVSDGQTAVIGGMIQDSFSETFFKIPFLGDIPVIGRIFGSTTREKVKQEIVVFLTPHVIESPGQLARQSQEAIQAYAYVPTEVMNAELDRWLRNLEEDTHAYHYNRGTVLLEAGRVDEAIEALEKARDASPADAATRVNLALALARASFLDRAEAELREAMRLDPTDAEIPYDLGAVLWRRNDFPQAMRMFERALLIDPNHPEARRWLSRARAEAARVERELLRQGAPQEDR